MHCKILIVEDDLTFGTIVLAWCQKKGFDAILATGIHQAKREFREHAFDLVLTDLRLPDGDGIMLLTWVKERKAHLPVIIMTSYAEIQSAVMAIKLGAFDFLEKPVNPAILEQKIEQALLSEKEIVPPIQKMESEIDMVYGKSRAAKEMFEHIRLVAPTRLSVLILGESGTGKEYAARLIHDQSTRNKAPFVAVDCGSLSKELAPSELFGHLKGSFTSAIADKKGVFEEADKGTVFLDEVGNLSYEVQVQLLRTLQEQKIRPVGSAKDIKVDVRIIAATNEYLPKAISEGKFREDLYHRLNEFSITTPPLRDRMEDLPQFAAFFLKEANVELGKNIRSLSTETLALLGKYSWSGNLRELRNVIRRAVLFAQTEEILPENLPCLSSPSEKTDIEPLNHNNERERIEAALHKTGGNKAEAARLLKIDRKTLYNKMHQYGMEL